MSYYECSAKTGANVKQAVEALTKEVLMKFGNKSATPKPHNVDLQDTRKLEGSEKKSGYRYNLGAANNLIACHHILSYLRYNKLLMIHMLCKVNELNV
jgi:hypothetical protein